MKRRIAAGLVLGTTLATVPAAAAMASSAAKPSKVAINWSFTRIHVRENKQVSLKYAVGHVPKSDSVVLQRTFGTAQQFETVEKLGSGQRRVHGRMKITAPELGKYVYRVAVLDGKKVVAAKKRTLFSYGTIPINVIKDSRTYTVNIHGHLYRYYLENGAGTEGVLHFNKTSCRYARLSAAKKGGGAGSTGHVNVVQETADPYRLDVTPGHVVTGGTALSGDAVTISLSDPNDGGYSYMNGSLTCYTNSGKR